MFKSLSFLKNLIGRIHFFFKSISFSKRLLVFYFLFSLPFWYYHERHLPIFFSIPLVSLAGLLSLLTLFLSFFILSLFFKKPFTFWLEIPYIGGILLFFHALGILENRGGLVFLFLVFLVFLLFRITKSKIYYQIILVGIAILANGLLSFQFLQKSEEILFQWVFHEKYREPVEEFWTWEYDESKKIWKNPSLPLSFQPGEEFVFHNPKDLKSKDMTGSGGIMGIINPSSKDPGIYPYLRFFLITGYNRADFSEIKEEFQKILEHEERKGEMESITSLGDIEEPKHKFPGHFWRFYDRLRPRYGKAGFYLVRMGEGKVLIIDIREIYSEDSPHSEEIQKVLDSLNFSGSFQ